MPQPARDRRVQVFGGAAAPPQAAPLVHIRSDVCLPVVILGVYNYFSKFWAGLPHITDRRMFQLTILIFNKKLNLLNMASRYKGTDI